MANLECDIIWKIKDEILLCDDTDVTNISIDNITFTHKSGRVVTFNFNSYAGNFKDEQKIIDFTGSILDKEYTTESLKYCGDSCLIPEEYDYSFFENGYMYLDSNHPDNGIKVELEIDYKTIDERNYIELAFVRIRDLDNNKNVILFNNLSQREYDEYLGC